MGFTLLLLVLGADPSENGPEPWSVTGQINLGLGADDGLFTPSLRLPPTVFNRGGYGQLGSALNFRRRYPNALVHFDLGNAFRPNGDSDEGLGHAWRVGAGGWYAILPAWAVGGRGWAEVTLSTAENGVKFRAFGADLTLRWRVDPNWEIDLHLATEGFDSDFLDRGTVGPGASVRLSRPTYTWTLGAQWLGGGGFSSFVVRAEGKVRPQRRLTLEGTAGLGTFTEGKWAYLTLGGFWELQRGWQVGGEYRLSHDALDAVEEGLYGHYLGAAVRFEWLRDDSGGEGAPSESDLALEQPPRRSEENDRRGFRGQGRVTVRIRAPAGTRRIAVRGDFTRWRMRALRRVAGRPNTWFFRARLKGGRYRYQLRVDGEIMLPKNADDYVEGNRGESAVMVIDRPDQTVELRCCRDGVFSS